MLSSLRARLFAWLLLPLLGFLLVSAALSYTSSRRTAQLLEDNTLLASARMLVEAVYWHEGALVAPVPPAALELFESPYQDHVYYRVSARPIAVGTEASPGSDPADVLASDGTSRLLAGAPELAERAAQSAATADHSDLSAPSLRAPVGDPTPGAGSTIAPVTHRSASREDGRTEQHDDGGGPPRYFDTVYNGMSLRAVAYDRLVYDADRTDRVTVVVAKTRESTFGLVETLWHPQLWRQILLACLALLLVPIGLTIELKPLLRLRDDVANRDPTALVPLRTAHLPAELQPIVDTINQGIGRLKQQANTQRQFIADAAHQMRTPLTVLDTQLQYLQQAGPGSPGWPDAIAGLQRTSKRMASMTNQLLMLAQAEAATRHPLEAQVDLTEIIGDVLSEMIISAERNAIDLGAEWGAGANGEGDADGAAIPMYVAGNAGLLGAMIGNLVDNAIRYTAAHWARVASQEGRTSERRVGAIDTDVATQADPVSLPRHGGHVTVSCRYEMQKGVSDGATPPVREIVLSVADNGPGIPAEARAHVFERFYRVHGEVESDGSGLGLAIVEQIAHAHHGTVTLSTPRWVGVASLPATMSAAGTVTTETSPGIAGEGLCVTVRLPAWREGEQT
jgi:two-component system sensor histidine kinase TctE